MTKEELNKTKKFCKKQLAILDEIITDVNNEGYDDVLGHEQYIKNCDAYTKFIRAYRDLVSIERNL